MSKLIKIYWGEGKILPQAKLANLQGLGAELIKKFMLKQQSRSKKSGGSKDGSGQSKRKKSKLICLSARGAS